MKKNNKNKIDMKFVQIKDFLHNSSGKIELNQKLNSEYKKSAEIQLYDNF